MISMEHAVKSLGGSRVLHDVTLSVDAGQALAIVGANGSSKSVALRAMSLIDPPDKGIVRCGETEYRFSGANGQDPLPRPWPTVTLVFQQLFLWPHMTMRENILLGARRVHEDPVEILEGLASDLEIEDVLERYPNQASGGQRQRVAIARAIALRPSFIFLDEPTGAQDINHTRLILGVLQRMKSEGTGIVFVTHQLGFAAALADEVAFLSKGHMIERGAPHILRDPETSHMREFISYMELV